MNNDLIAMIGNFSRSLHSVEYLIAGFGYIIGILLVFTAIIKFKKIGDARANSSSEEKMMAPIAYLVLGAALIFLPTILDALSNSAFGNGNILQYIQVNPQNIYNSMDILIQTAGLIWFVRGCVLLLHQGQPGAKEGRKGITFIFAGILAMNLQGAYGMLNYIMIHVLHLTSPGP